MAQFPYWILPIISAGSWFVTCCTLLIYWLWSGQPVYSNMSEKHSGQTIPYVSDIAGQPRMKPLFFLGCIIMAVALDAGFIADRWLRHKTLISRKHPLMQNIIVSLTLFFAALGTTGVILLNVFDTLRYPNVHRVCLLLFMVGLLCCAVFFCWEYRRMGATNKGMRILRISFWVKICFIFVEFVLVTTGVFCSFFYKGHENFAVVLEWMAAFFFPFYVLTHSIDLWLAAKGRVTLEATGSSESSGSTPANGDDANAAEKGEATVVEICEPQAAVIRS